MVHQANYRNRTSDSSFDTQRKPSKRVVHHVLTIFDDHFDAHLLLAAARLMSDLLRERSIPTDDSDVP